MPPKAFADLANLPEDDRIALIAEAAAAGNIVGVFVDNDESADRYTKKLDAKGVRVLERVPKAVRGTNVVLLRVGPKGH